MHTDNRLFARLLLPSGILAGILLAAGVVAAYRVSSLQRETSRSLDRQLANFRWRAWQNDCEPPNEIDCEQPAAIWLARFLNAGLID
jgi:hypothetical protein